MRILLISKDTDQYTSWFPQGLAYLAAVLLKEGYDVEIYNQDVHHYPDEHLTRYLNQKDFDVVGVGAIGGYYQYRKLLKISEAINNSKNRPFYIIGGHCPSPEPEYFIKKTQADVIVIGEGELTV
ncbi:MAG: cobalamin B12-binding domain-containing protein, partial [Candidatus Pacebacteria bacterium]|nr:cobalamin B12-binding domain-containing protein [Candidatus Paceibacterota bacterium]